MKPQPIVLVDALLEKKPMARAVRVTLFEREVREKLSVAAIEILLERARILSEGKRSASPTAAAREAERLADTPVRVRAGEVRVRAQGTLVHLDVDVEE